MMFSVMTSFLAYASYSSSQIKEQIDSVFTYKQKIEGVKSLQSLVSDVLPKQAGVSAEWYALSLLQYSSSYDFSKYRAALEKHALSGQGNPTEKEKFALLLAATGYSGSYITDTIENSTGQLGIMSEVYSLHLLNLGYTAKTVSKASVISELLSRQLQDGGWALSGQYGDVDVTAMTLQAISQNISDKKVKSAVDKGILFLSSKIGEDTEYQSYGSVNSESASQTIIALSALGVDVCKDSRFIRNGKTLIDTLMSYKQADGSFSHVHDKSGDANATVQALMAFVSYYRFLNGKGSIYKFSVKIPAPTTTQPPVTTKPVTTTKRPAVTTKPSTTSKPVTTTRASSQNGLNLFGLFGSNRDTTSATTTSTVIYDDFDDVIHETTAATVIFDDFDDVIHETTTELVIYDDFDDAPELTSLQEAVTSVAAETSSQSQTASQPETVEANEITTPTESQVTQYTTAESVQSDEVKEKPSAIVYVTAAALIIIIGVSAFVVYKKRY